MVLHSLLEDLQQENINVEVLYEDNTIEEGDEDSSYSKSNIKWEKGQVMISHQTIRDNLQPALNTIVKTIDEVYHLQVLGQQLSQNIE